MIELKKHIAAVVVLFNPDESVFRNLYSYVSQVNKIYAIDNSELKIKNEVIDNIKKISNLEYLTNHANLGVAAALNIGAAKAIEEGFDYLLTMDQDSKATEFMVERLAELFDKYSDAAIITPFHLNEGFPLPSDNTAEQELLFTITSGNLLSLEKYKKVGGFLEKLFIDYVDHEYCLRLHSVGFKIIRLNNVVLYHNLGKLKREEFFGIEFFPSHHSPERYYYRTRNRFYVNDLYKKRFKDYVKSDRRRFFRELIEMFFFESEILKKLHMIVKGYIDYKKKRFAIL
ncbi:MAG TPA: glycosyltransferase family 2 protein [Ignavibacteriaceae bacterium]|nr:glycosyltransferase family 2 protein [Ignavibacteriaceae bacterium]